MFYIYTDSSTDSVTNGTRRRRSQGELIMTLFSAFLANIENKEIFKFTNLTYDTLRWDLAIRVMSRSDANRQC